MKWFFLSLSLCTVFSVNFASADVFSEMVRNKLNSGTVADEKFLLAEGGNWKCKYHSNPVFDKIFSLNLNFTPSRRNPNFLILKANNGFEIVKKKLIWSGGQYQGSIKVSRAASKNRCGTHRQYGGMTLRAHGDELIIDVQHLGIMECRPDSGGCFF